MSMVGELSCFLELQIKQRSEGLFISQEKYAKNIVKKFGLDQSQHKSTPAATHVKITQDINDTAVDHKLYRSMIGTLLYLTTSRPDIAYAVGIYWAGFTDDRKSASSGCFFLGNNLISWFSKKQNSVSLSTAEAEYIAVGSGCTQLIWMKNMLHEYEITQDVMTMYCDNMNAIDISKNPIQRSRTKYIDIRHHFIRELIENKIITLEHIRSNSQLADIFTKPLDATTFDHLRAGLEGTSAGKSSKEVHEASSPKGAMHSVQPINQIPLKPMRGWGPYVQDLDSVLKGITYLLTLKRVGVNSVLHHMFPTIHSILSLKCEAYWANANELHSPMQI
ncbi:gag-pol polyprotein [Cucumis melo var. makuwa]|uniref:Gag-pol polyprotein n=1 Tax=Cucumis melo var. makuwa TaxID=1194695 RepID=A0A5A7TZB3_CUCMM|nr:gag-pol polyprotein [Cucumis melo var. makuwa]TYK10653.1 gag-pol polyprotein [Cucumis melo var. makuwa]